MEKEIPALLLLLVAHGGPLLVRMVWPGAPLGMPLDGGRRLADGRPLLGSSKTVRGVLVMSLAPAVMAPLVGLPFAVGLLLGLLCAAGDLGTSFVKRRLGLAPGAMALGLDQLPEALLPLLACKPLLGLGWGQVLLVALLFMAADLLISRIFYWMGFRQHPH
jgi:CDP-2,3-bis-(O-geranylgeranyl)-sn-glycerol synthase